MTDLSSLIEWADAVGKPEGGVIQRDPELDAYLKDKYPESFA